MAVVHIMLLPILKACPIHDHPLKYTLSLIFYLPVLCKRLVLEILSGRLILRIFRKQSSWKVSSSFLPPSSEICKWIHFFLFFPVYFNFLSVVGVKPHDLTLRLSIWMKFCQSKPSDRLHLTQCGRCGRDWGGGGCLIPPSPTCFNKYSCFQRQNNE